MPIALGTRLGPYEILALLGAGGMGEVYRALDTRLDREVALKLLPRAVEQDPGRLARLEREARLLASLNHPGIAAIHELEEAGGVRFLVMELVQGESLESRLSRGALPVAEALDLGRQIAEALEAAHEKGIIHRDLKPGNVMLTPDGRAKLLDFGLAKALRTAGDEQGGSESPTISAAVTRDGDVRGTVAYMSPEHARGKAVDKRTDIWAFGCVLFEMVTGRRAFGGETTADVLAGIVGREPDWSLLPAATPRRVRELLHRCCRKDLSKRLRDVGDALLDLEEARGGEPASPAIGGAAPSAGRSTMLAWGVACAALLLAIGAVVMSRPRAPSGRAEMRFSTVTNLGGVESQPALSPDGGSIAFIANRDGQWDIYVGLVTGGNLIRLTNDASFETRPRWSPDGTRILFARLNDAGLNDIWVVPALGGPARRILLNGLNPTWSPDGRTIAYSAGSTIWVSDASGENPRALAPPDPPFAYYQPTFSHDGRSIAFIRRGDRSYGSMGPYGELMVVDVATGAMKPLTSDDALAMSPAWSPDDRFIYFTSSRGGTLNIWKIPANSGEPEQITAGQGDDADIDLSADGKRLVFATYRANVNLAELSIAPSSSGKMTWLTTDSARTESEPRYSPDGRRIAYFSNRKAAERESIWVMDADGGNAIRLVDDGRINTHPRWTSDSQALLYSSRAPRTRGVELRRVALAGGAPEVVPVKPWGSVWGDVAPDGRLIYRTSMSGGELYNPNGNQRQPVADLFGDPLWSRNGKQFAFVAPPSMIGPSSPGLWIGTPDGPHREVFRGWVVSFAWAGNGELLVVEGKSDLIGVLWRVDANGRREVILSKVPLMMTPFGSFVGSIRFDVHPDGRRIAMEALEVFESDIGMIDNVR